MVQHFYSINEEKQQLLVYKNKKLKDKNFKPNKYINLREVKRILYGFNSENLKKRHSYLTSSTALQEPWLFLSLELPKRTIDFYMESEKILKKWFYGLKYLIENNNLNIKTMSVHSFIFTKLKLRLITELKDMSNNNANIIEDEQGSSKSLNVLNELKNYTKAHSYNFNTLSVTQVMRLYIKVKQINLDKPIEEPYKSFR